MECYKHPFHQAANILKGSTRNVKEKIFKLKNFKSYGLICGIGYRVTDKGVLVCSIEEEEK